jgi:hypothetical protein
MKIDDASLRGSIGPRKRWKGFCNVSVERSNQAEDRSWREDLAADHHECATQLAAWPIVLTAQILTVETRTREENFRAGTTIRCNSDQKFD